MVTIYIPGAFPHADSDKHIIMVLKGNLDLLMSHVGLKLYRKHIIFNKRGKPVLYVKILKVLYGLIQSAILFYRKLVKYLQKYGLKMIPYDPCAFNGMNNGKKLTVTFHVDDLKVSHMDPFEITFFCVLPV